MQGEIKIDGLCHDCVGGSLDAVGTCYDFIGSSRDGIATYTLFEV